MNNNAPQNTKGSDGKWVLMCFIAFFGVIIAVNALFISNALHTHSGVITKNPYEKGLAFNETLEKARNQPDIKNEASYKDGTLRWTLPIQNATVTATFVRSIKDGDDFEILLKHVKDGIYEARAPMPHPGAWTAKLKATWNNTQFQTSHSLITQ